MSEDINMILDFSLEAQMLLEQQGVDIYEEIQREIPSVRLELQTDPRTTQGTRDVVTVIAVTATLVSALTPIILRILNIITPPDHAQTWVVEEIETLHPDGKTTVHRKRVYSSSEQRPYLQQTDQSKSAEIAPSEMDKDIKK